MKVYLFFLILSTTPSWGYRTIKIESSLTIENQVLKEIEKNLNDHCPIDKNSEIDITAMPQNLIPYLKEEAGRTNSLNWIEVNPMVWRTLSSFQKKILIMHELGHVMGLAHVAAVGKVMSQTNLAQKVDLDSFWSDVLKKCNQTDISKVIKIKD